MLDTLTQQVAALLDPFLGDSVSECEFADLVDELAEAIVDDPRHA